MFDNESVAVRWSVGAAAVAVGSLAVVPQPALCGPGLCEPVLPRSLRGYGVPRGGRFGLHLPARLRLHPGRRHYSSHVLHLSGPGLL